MESLALLSEPHELLDTVDDFNIGHWSEPRFSSSSSAGEDEIVGLAKSGVEKVVDVLIVLLGEGNGKPAAHRLASFVRSCSAVFVAGEAEEDFTVVDSPWHAIGVEKVGILCVATGGGDAGAG